MSVSTTTSVSAFMGQYVESQNRTSATFSATEETAITTALAEFQLNSAQLQQVGQLLNDLEVMRGLVATQSLSPTSLDAVELSIQMLLQGAAGNAGTVQAPATMTVQSQALPPDVQAFSDEYLTSTYLQNATTWPGADTRLQADLGGFNLAPIERAVATQYLYSIADQRRYLATIDAALKAPDGFLYATETDDDYPAYLAYKQARDATAAMIDSDVATVQGILAHAFPVTQTGFDQIPWSVRLTDPLTAVPPSTTTDQIRFEISEDNFLMSQLGSQARAIEGQISQLTTLLSPKTQPPLLMAQIIQYSTQLTDLKRQLKLIGTEFTALQARVAYNTSLAAGTPGDANKALTIDLNVSAAQAKLAAFAPTPVDNGGPSEPVPTDLQQKLSADRARYAALVADPNAPPPPDFVPPPLDPGQPPPPPPPIPEPTQQLIQGYIDHITYLMEVPSGMQLTPEQVDELGLLLAHRQALRIQLQNVNAELAALKDRIDYAQAVVLGVKPYQASEWERLTQAVVAAQVARMAGETVPPTAGAITTPPPVTVAWKLSGGNVGHIEVTRIENFLLDQQENDLVYQRLSEFSAYVGAVERDTQTAPAEAAALTTTISKLTSSSQSAQKTAAQLQQVQLNTVIEWLEVFELDAATAYANAEDARTVTVAAQVDAALAGVDASMLDMLHDEYLLAQKKLSLAMANEAYYETYAQPTTQRTLYYDAITQLSANVAKQAQYAESAAKATDPVTRQSDLDALATYQDEYEDLLANTLARYFDYAYSITPSASTWPRTLPSSLTTEQKAAEVISHYNGDVYTVIDAIATTAL